MPSPVNPNRILAGLVIGLVGGALTLVLGVPFPSLLDGARAFSTAILDPVGQIFLRLLFFVVIPLVFASLASGVVQLGNPSKLGPLAARTFFLFAANMIIGAALGLLLMNILNPGGALSPETRDMLIADFSTTAITATPAPSALSLPALVEMFLPRNLLGAVTGQSRNAIGDVLPLIVFAILVGVAGFALPENHRRKFSDALDIISGLMTAIVHLALKLAPFAVPAMIYSVVVRVGVDIILALGLFVLACAGGMLIHLVGTMSLWLVSLARVRPLQFFRDIRSVLVTAFSTSSSNATLPASIACAKETLGVRPGVAGFVLPLGATMNMSGSALYEGCVVLFAAQVFGIDLTLAQQGILLVLSVISAVAVAGIPGGTLPLIAGLLATFGVPPEGIFIILGVDRILDMMRTTLNVAADLVTAVIINRWMK